MDNANLPTIPEGVDGSQVCATVRLQLAVLSDLPPEQAQALHEHIQDCAECAAELRLLNRVTQLVSDFADQAETAPSARVDQAVLAAIAARSKVPVAQRPDKRKPVGRAIHERRRSLQWIGQLAIEVVLVLAALTAIYFHSAQTFAIPANVSWSGYVLYHSQTLVGTNGVHYRVESYHDLSTNRMHVETTLPGRLDVVAVSNSHETLGKDMMHHTVQWGASDWSVDDSLFDLATLRRDIQAHRAVYVGKDRFQGQDIYRIRFSNGLIMLLDMNYMPVNVLRSETGEPLYNTLSWLRPSQVPASTWDMSMPQGFQEGALPGRP
jgi:hypothetical protein